jgi:tetratricopeptide (TPR) repeat protein/DNA-binding XRE family transcriptional regulator
MVKSMDSILSSAFGELLRSFRKRRRLTQQQLAEKLGVHRNTISNWEHGDFLPESKGVVLELARQLHLDEQETRQLLEASLTAIASYWNAPYPRNPFFTGREDILYRLHEQLHVDRATGLAQSCALYGLGGVGKTQTALEYAYRYSQEYAAVFWIGAQTGESMMASFLRIADILQLPERQEAAQQRMVAAVQQWLMQHRDWLLIWDNVEDLQLLQRFLPSVRQGATLLTTRAPALGTLAQGIELMPMTAEEGLLLLLRRAKVFPATTSREQLRQFAEQRPTEYTAARHLVQSVDGLPLALDQVGAYLEETGNGLEKYLRIYEVHRQQLLDRRGTPGIDHPASVAATFSLAFERVERANPAAAELLCLCAFLHPDAIPEEMIVEGAPHLGAILEPVVVDPYQFDLAVATLRALSLVSRHPETNTFSIHRLVQAVLRDRMELDIVREWIERTVRVVNAAFPQAEFVVWPRCERYLPQVQACQLLIKEASISSPEAARLLHEAGSYLLQRGRYAESELFFLQALMIREQQPGSASLEVATTLNYLGWSYWSQGKYKQAEPVYLRALLLGEQEAGPPHREVAATLNNLAVLYGTQGRYLEAEPLHQRAMSIREQQLGLEHPTVAESLHNLALLYNSQGRYEQAEPLLQRAVSIRKQQLGSEHPDVAISLQNLARLYWSQGRYAEAEPLYQQALRIYQQQLGSEHPYTSTCMNNLAMLYRDQGKCEQAETLYLQVLRIRERLLGSLHPDTAESFHSLATLYEKQGKYEQAEPLFLRALDIRKEQLGTTHPDTARSLIGLAILYEKLGNYKRARPLLQHACTILEQRLGPAHPETVKAMNDYQNLLALRRSSTKAREEQPKQGEDLQGKLCSSASPLNLASAPEAAAVSEQAADTGLGGTCRAAGKRE